MKGKFLISNIFVLLSASLVILYDYKIIKYISFFYTVIIFSSFVLHLFDRLHLFKHYIMQYDDYFEMKASHYNFLKYSEYALLGSILTGIYSHILLDNIPHLIIFAFFLSYFLYTAIGLYILKKYKLK